MKPERIEERFLRLSSGGGVKIYLFLGDGFMTVRSDTGVGRFSLKLRGAMPKILLCDKEKLHRSTQYRTMKALGFVEVDNDSGKKWQLQDVIVYLGLSKIETILQGGAPVKSAVIIL